MITIASCWFNNLGNWFNSFGYMLDQPYDIANHKINQQSLKLVAVIVNRYGSRNNNPLLSDQGTTSSIRSSTYSFFVGDLAEQYLSKSALANPVLGMNSGDTELSWNKLCLDKPGALATELSDNELIVKIAGGDRELFAELVQRYQKKIASLIYSLIRIPDEVDDIAQDVFITVYRSLDRFEFRSSFSTWVYRITINKCHDWERKRYRHKYWFKDWASLEFTAATQENSEDCLAVRQQVNQLGEKYRVVIVLYYFQGLKCQEIASILKVSSKTVETRLLRARRLLADRLREV